MARQMAAAMALLVLTAGFAQQQDSFTKNFRAFKDVVPGIDFYAAARNDVAPLEQPVREARERLSTFLGKDLTRGALVICSSLEQRDSVGEPRLLRMGYRWALIQLTPEVTNQQRLAQIKAQMGGMVPPELLARLQNPSPDMRAAFLSRVVGSLVQKVANATLVTTLTPEREFRSSRLDDMGRSPLADWIDIGLLSYAAGTAPNLRFLQDRMEEAFPLEDVISMSRPFIVPNIDGGSGGGGQMRIVTAGGRGPGGSQQAGPGEGRQTQMVVPGGGSGGMRSGDRGGDSGGMRGGAMNLPKDVQDRMLFDAQASSFFSYLIQKVGIEKCKTLVRANRENQNARNLVLRPDMLGPDIDAIEKDWQDWLKKQKPDGPANMQIITAPGRPGADF
jgi:hypothetical protein